MRAAKWFLLAVLAMPAFAQMTPEQKEFDFRLLAANYAKHYAPYEWKRQLFNFDALEIGPWLEQVRKSKDDLDFIEICARYVASLRDTHSSYFLPSTFSATLGLHADIYDGKAVIDNITRSRLPVNQYPFAVGDEIVEMDGKPVEEWLNYFEQFVYNANPRSARRRAAQALAFRGQFSAPRAHEIGDAATVVIRRRVSGELETYEMPWLKAGVPVIHVGNVPSPLRSGEAVPGTSREPDNERWLPEWLDPLADLRNERVEQPGFDVLNVGSITPIWPLPSGFQRRMGNFGEPFLTGTYTSQGQRIGLIRIPNFSPPVATATAIRLFETEIAFLQANTDGLVIDITRNNGGDACYNEELQRRLIPHTMRGMAREIRATTRFLNNWYNALEAARRTNQPAHVIAQLEKRYQDVEAAFRENRGRTGPLPICNESLERLPADIVYTKPIMVLIDEFSISAADGFAAVLQDNKRALFFGWRTNGAGGTTGSFPVGIFSEGSASHTIAMHYRRDPVVTPEYPVTHYVENVGVRPDIEFDYMTVDNLVSNGRVFVDAFTAAMLEHIRKNQ
jgi:hypothetical protein